MEKFEQMTSKKFYFYLLTVVFSFAAIITVLSGTKVMAADPVVNCQVAENLYGGVQDAQPDLDIRRTAVNYAVASVFEGIPFVGMGKNNSVMQKCGVIFLEQNGASLAEGESCNIESTECDEFTFAYGQNGSLASKSTTPGTLLGLSNTARAAVMTEPVPVNLAYWWNDGMARIPFAGKALAAPPDYNGAPFLDIILGVWKFTRNLAYGLMSIVMLVVGFMIITRKKIGAQAAVTVQLALPKIIIALILITFSYPIGAFGASLAYALRGNTTDIVNTIDAGIGDVDDEGSSGQKASIAIISTVVMLLGGGALAVILALIAAIAGIVFLLIFYVKMFVLYLKILFSIITAPLIFTFGAIPGNEEQTTKWFKRFAAYVISIPAMWFISALSWKLTWQAMIKALMEPGGFIFGGGVLMLLIIPFFFLFGLNFARQVPDKIEAAIVGDTKKR